MGKTNFKRIGIVVATDREQEPFFEVFGEPTHTISKYGHQISIWTKENEHTICLIRSGYGIIAATMATQCLIDHCHIDMIINYGAVGALRDMISATELGIVHKIIHYSFDLSGGGKYPKGVYPKIGSPYIEPNDDIFSDVSELDEYVCASADKFVYGGEPKRNLHKEFHADVCDMESAGIVLTCNHNKIPCGFIKAVSDGVDEDQEAFEENVYEASRKCVDVIATFIRIWTLDFFKK